MRRLILMVGALMVASVVQAEVIAWRVDLGAANSSFETAELFATMSTGDYWSDAATSQSGGKINKMDNTYGVLTYESTLTVNDSYSFFVKLYDVNNIMVGYSALKSWATLSTEGSLASGIAPDLPATAWNAVPEPTAMALLAMGVSAMLLRRKRVA
jgi:hypothetical protein